MNEIELAHVNDVDRCLEIIDSGKKFQNDQGFTEWTDDYPNRESILEDIEKFDYVLSELGYEI